MTRGTHRGNMSLSDMRARHSLCSQRVYLQSNRRGVVVLWRVRSRICAKQIELFKCKWACKKTTTKTSVKKHDYGGVVLIFHWAPLFLISESTNDESTIREPTSSLLSVCLSERMCVWCEIFAHVFFYMWVSWTCCFSCFFGEFIRTINRRARTSDKPSSMPRNITS